MVQATNGAACPPLWPRARGRLLVEGTMHAILVIVPDVISNQPPQMEYAQHDHVVQQLSATASYPTLRHAVLPGTAIGGSNQLAAQAFQHGRDFSAELAVTIQDEIPRCTILRKGFSLLHDPLSTGMFCGIEVQDSPPAVADHKEAVKD